MAEATPAKPSQDQWAEWLLHRRHGGSPAAQRRLLEALAPVRDKVISNARIAPGETVLDVGTGDGLIAFAALERVGERGRVIFSDVSPDLLDHNRSLAERLGLTARCRFVRAAAEDLALLPDASVDVVTTRAVLLYVEKKARAFAEFWRVLRPGGRISLYEPINRVIHDEPSDRLWGFDVAPVQELAARVRAVYRRHLPLDRDPMLAFDERDLLALAAAAGFEERHLEYRLDAEPHQPRPWPIFLHASYSPRVPTLAEATAAALTPAEAERFATHLRPLVEAGRGVFSAAVAYLWATKHPAHRTIDHGDWSSNDEICANRRSEGPNPIAHSSPRV